VVSGEWDETCVRPLNGYGQEILKRGQTDSFLMAVPRPMGPLQYVRVWHDNSGPSEHGSWFLNYIIIVDLQTKIKYPFVANRWLAVEEEDGEVSPRKLFVYISTKYINMKKIEIPRIK